MAFKRRYRKRTRRYRRKMRIARPMRKFKRTTYDGIYYAKIHSRVAVTAGSYTSGSVSVTWGSSGTSTTSI